MEVLVLQNDKSACGSVHEDFHALFKSYYPYVLRQVMFIIPEQSIAEDITQDVFLKLYDADISALENIPAWLTKVGVNTTYNYLRMNKRRMARDERSNETADAYSPSAEENWMKRDEVYVVRQALAGMEERDRTLLLMKYSGFPYKELAQAINVESSSIGTLLIRAKQKFKEQYELIRGDDI